MPKELHEEFNFRHYAYFVLKQVHPDAGITQEAINELNFMIHHCAEQIMQIVNTLLEHSTQVTISSRAIQNATRLHLSSELAKHAISEGTKAVTKYMSSIHSYGAPKKGSKSMSRSQRAGLQFSVSRVEHLIRHYRQSCYRVGEGAPVYFAAVLEYLCAEVLELAGNAARDNKRTRITTRHILLAVKNDEELSTLFKDATLSGGVLPNIHAVLLPKKPTGSSKPSKKPSGSSKPPK